MRILIYSWGNKIKEFVILIKLKIYTGNIISIKLKIYIKICIIKIYNLMINIFKILNKNINKMEI